MKNETVVIRALRVVVLFTLFISFSLPSSADIFDDFQKAADLLKQAGNISSNKAPPPNIPAKPDQQNSSAPQDLSLKLSHPEYYYERPSLFNSLGFDIGEYTVIEPLDKATFNNLYVPSFKGIPVLALTPSYPQVKIDVNTKNVVATRFKNDMLIYHNLRLLALMAKHVTAENLKVDKSNKAQFLNKSIKDIYSIREKTQESDKYFYHYAPRFHIQSLVTTLLPSIHNLYFCEAEQCFGDRFQRSVFNWGGYNKNNEFKSRRAYFKFIETEVPKLKAWAKSLSHETYIVGTVGLGEYDFDRKGFELFISAPRGPYQQFFYAPRDTTKLVFSRGNDTGQAFFLAVDETKAEALESQSKTTPNRQYSQLYFAVKGEVYNAQYSGADRRPHNQTYASIHLAYDVTGTTIEFFTDELLTKKVFEAKVNH